MKFIVFLLTAIFIAGCSTTPPAKKFVADPAKKWEQRKTNNDQHTDKTQYVTRLWPNPFNVKEVHQISSW